MKAPLLRPLARFTADYSPTPQTDRDNLRLFTTMADYSSALLAGIGHPLYPRYLAALAGDFSGRGPATVIGLTEAKPVAAAAAANAAISHLWEVDDAHRQSTSHPGITVIPAVIALSQALPDVPTARIRGAVVAGFEAVIRLGSYLGPDHYAVCHTTATAGTFGAAAAVSHLLGLDEQHCLWAFGHAGTQAQGLWQILDDDAADAKAFHAATAVRNGIAAAMMARADIPAAEHILEGPRGMLAAWQLSGGDPSWLHPVDGRMIHTVTVKNWPTCGQMHSALDCADELQGAGGYDPAQIDSIDIQVPAACGAIANMTGPKTVAAAKFSTTFCVAAALAGRRPDLRGLTDSLLADQAVRALADKARLTIDPQFSARFPAERPARVTIRLRDGRELSAQRSFRKGDPELPWDRPGMLQRTQDVLALSGRALDAPALLDWCERFARADCSDWSPNELFALAATKESCPA